MCCSEGNLFRVLVLIPAGGRQGATLVEAKDSCSIKLIDHHKSSADVGFYHVGSSKLAGLGPSKRSRNS